MNAAEHIVECYFRLVEKCLTITDVKVVNGINRQCDLLAANIKEEKYYHVETSVTHMTMWAPKIAELKAIFDAKFRGIPKEKENSNSEWKRGVTYFKNIKKTYRLFGFPPSKVTRVFICWIVKDKDKEGVSKLVDKYKKKYGIRVEVKSFKENILPELEDKVGTSNYDDEILRTISFIKESKKQR